MDRSAESLARFITALQGIDTAGGSVHEFRAFLWPLTITTPELRLRCCRIVSMSAQR
jgi:hypothetical protein